MVLDQIKNNLFLDIIQSQFMKKVLILKILLKLNRSTGLFTIPNHFFSDNEQLIYTPVSTFAGVGATALQMTGGSNLPTTVFVKKETNSTFKLATSSGGSP